MISRLINPHFGISAAFRRMTVPLMDIALDLPPAYSPFIAAARQLSRNSQRQLRKSKRTQPKTSTTTTAST